MKRIFAVLVIGISTLANAQFGLSFGLKGNALIRASKADWEGVDFKNKKDPVGFNVGFFSKIKLPIPTVPIFVMPEIYFSHYNSKATYETAVSQIPGGSSIPKIPSTPAGVIPTPKDEEIVVNVHSFSVDIPLLVGYDFAGIAGIFMGPVFHNQLRSFNKIAIGVEGATKMLSGGTEDIAKQYVKGKREYDVEYENSKKTSVGYQFGVNINLIPKLVITARYEINNKGEKRTYTSKFDNKEGKKDVFTYSNKPKFFVLGVGFNF